LQRGFETAVVKGGGPFTNHLTKRGGGRLRPREERRGTRKEFLSAAGNLWNDESGHGREKKKIVIEKLSG